MEETKQHCIYAWPDAKQDDHPNCAGPHVRPGGNIVIWFLPYTRNETRLGNINSQNFDRRPSSASAHLHGEAKRGSKHGGQLILLVTI